eukprot:Gregarina_sp_Poly_1__4@NODE_1001_length_5410_cov_144_854950_g702_i0_p2_GENE_NODE_1001_length_5410_cov_144_854950_g702_i0NODE_1001_length_5410_cov_144_854950_g702_i0_p2_ORF_typecomplete_len279_score43_50Sec66/PF09802_9/3_9e14CD34_antigen/PF06365_12/1_8CD34_antigen/PF06365_12/97_NODE_1001_length_5410_cov_144_854950_g702_i040454881
MEVWMIICLALLLIGIGVLIYNNASTQRRKRLENEAFLAEADDMMGFHLTLTGREDYAQKLQATFNEFKAVKKWRDEDLEQDPLLTDPVDAWQRNLPADKINSLKAHLIKRMVNVLGQAAPFQQELQTRFVMLQRGLISEQQWKQFAEAKNALDQEILLIKFEAECLQDKFGNEGIVFKEANKFYLHELQKKKMELNKARLANISPEMIQELAKRSGGRIVLQGPNGGPVPAAVKAPSESPMPVSACDFSPDVFLFSEVPGMQVPIHRRRELTKLRRN